jgi:GNAT superfamily N-acetyltransferase
MSQFISPELLDASHVCGSFDCGIPALNQFLHKHALQNQQADAARTYVTSVETATGKQVVGFYTLTAGSIAPDDAPERIRKGLARHPVPVVLLARLAIDVHFQGQGLGKALFKNVLLRTAQAADVIAARCLLVHAKDEAAKQFYQRYDLEVSPTHPLHLFLLMKDLRRALGKG